MGYPGLGTAVRDTGRQMGEYGEWAGSALGAGGSWDEYQRWLSQLTGAGLGSIPSPYQPPPPQQLPMPSGGAAFAPPPVVMPEMLPNPTPQGLGGMPLVRDRMMAQVMAPFAQPNWGVPQVPAQYLTQQMPLPSGSVTGIPVTLPDTRNGRMTIPRQPPRGTAA